MIYIYSTYIHTHADMDTSKATMVFKPIQSPPLNSATTALTLCALILSNRSTLITNVPRPALKLLKCFKYPTISFSGTLAVIVRGRFVPASIPNGPDPGIPAAPSPADASEDVSKGSRGA